ncbi:PAN domain protein [Oesophagostomum dentatum]|uniref:PAN domain protein n=1 Tax=Oesophagostomum dentatum TaxID=61180 RepID=A0A0B1TRM5_OESDE|nr:PAN domain protein [Oesophagostomum dentatum]
MIRFCWISAALLITFGNAKAVDTLERCFEKTTRRAVDNYRPLAEYQMESLSACADYCIMTAGNVKRKNPLCLSFTYNVARKSCHLYDHDGMKVPAILYPAIGVDFYKRNGGDACGGTTAFETNSHNFATFEGVPEKKVESTTDFVTVSEPLRNQDVPREVIETVDHDIKVLQKKSAKELNTISKNSKEVQHNEPCLTSNAYYVVIGNEIVRPIANGGEVKIYGDVNQGDCANFCSKNHGPDQQEISCSSLNYFPLTKKCELYSILAEPHGPGSLVENDEVIYAEKFCLPESSQRCQEDEIFVLHVQKSLSGIPLQQTSSGSITSCLRSCLDNYSCMTAVFDSMKQQCHLYSSSVSKSQTSIVDTPPGFVMIENGCAEGKGRTNKSSERIPNKIADSSSEWSDCSFRISGVRVKVRTTENGTLETSAC